MNTKGIFLVIEFSFVTLLCHSQDISGKYYYNQSESNIEELISNLIEDNPIMLMMLSDSAQSEEIFEMLPKQIIISDTKISMIHDGKEQLISNDISVKKNGKNNGTIIFVNTENKQSDEITYSVKDKQKVINWHGLIYKTN